MNVCHILRKAFYFCRISGSLLQPLQRCNLSNLRYQRNSIRNTGLQLSREATCDNALFLKSFPRVVSDMTANDDDSLKDFFEHFTRLLESTIPYGIMIHGLPAMKTYKAFHKRPQEISEEEMYNVTVMAWAFEILRAFLNIVDDIIDDGQERYGGPCWHKNSDIGMLAVVDGIVLYTKIFDLLKTHFHDKPYYHSFIELMNQLCWEIHVGQSLDNRCALKFRETRSLEEFTFKKQAKMTSMKTAGSLFCPIVFPMLMHGITDPDAYSQAKLVTSLLAELYTNRDDYLDVFGNVSELGKTPMDIKQGKCSWLILNALQICNNEQRQILKDNYGKPDTECVERVRNVFFDLKLDDVYRKCAKTSYDNIVNIIRAPTFKLPPSIITYYLGFFYEKD